MAVAEIAQHPTSPNIMYFATGESFGNGDAVRGNGVFKSIDGGATDISSHLHQRPSAANRTEIAVNGNTLYALPVDASTQQVPTIYKSTDGGANWAPTTGQPTSGWASQQGWYSLSAGIHPTDPNQAVVGGLDTFRTPDGGATWTKISAWVGAGQYVHADQHKVVWHNDGAGGTRLLFGSDGGILYSTG
ncbi:MAG: hypothetical protein IPK98_03060 [Chloracidobacterium sp.]|nr:hypothetical protein [Chloracidobacterium sp.]